MSKHLTRKAGGSRIADQIMAGVRELERMMDEGKKPHEMFTVSTVETSRRASPGITQTTTRKEISECQRH